MTLEAVMDLRRRAQANEPMTEEELTAAYAFIRADRVSGAERKKKEKAPKQEFDLSKLFIKETTP